MQKAARRDVELKMKKDSKCALKIKESIVIVLLFMIVGTSSQVVQVVKTEEQTAQIQEENEAENTQEEIEEGDASYQRNVELTTRSSEGRTSIEESKTQENVEEEQTAETTEQEIVEEPKTIYKSIDEITISKNMDLTVRCGVSKEDFKTLMKNLKPDTTDFFYNNSDTIYDLCEKYQINEVFFCGLIAAESGWKISSGHRSKCNYISMMSKGKLIQYSSPAEGLEAAAKLLHNKYLTPGGSYYSGKTLSAVKKKFCPSSSTWVNLVYGCMKQIVD